ncbi:glycoside hydrolase family 2 TIM barrel-domain containing protein [Saccharopolyspora shandongensis]|uniref:glycoside hydrolase family 2 TIM barrel-domain containing protein n=1 Tax=Saccharopolyspora shandongensis TaxID=418495 RepID=UPI0033FA86D4
MTGLGGTWQLHLDPPEDFHAAAADTTGPSWHAISVPGEPAMQGHEPPYDREFACVRDVPVPRDFEGHRIFIRFDAVYSYARLWVNGHFVRDHIGGFTPWEADITALVTPGGTARIALGITDRYQDLSYGSFYARHSLGGILRDVRLAAVPRGHLAALHVSTVFDENYRDALLHIDVDADTGDGTGAHQGGLALELDLRAPDGRPVPLTPARTQLDGGPQRLSYTVRTPMHWNAERPHLYTLRAGIGGTDSAPTHVLTKRIGFREVRTDGTRLLINGHPVTLRGAARHEIGPAQGRAATQGWAQRDAAEFKAANVNFIRTSHYPPDEAFLDAADEFGLYVEDETAVCWVNMQGHDNSLDDPAARDAWVGQLAELVERDRDHPSVIIWSTANENIGWGANPQAQWDYLKSHDPSRPVVYSHSEEKYSKDAKYDIYTVHYPAVDGDLGGQPVPTLYDEFSHLPCYNLDDLKVDPGVRVFWGESISRFWPRFHEKSDVCGGAIWAGIDEVYHLPGSVVGAGAWGLLDLWRRRKPEHWLARKAYSPVRIEDGPLTGAAVRAGRPLAVPVANWYDFTDLRSLTFRWRVGGESGMLPGPSVAPGQSGTLTIPARSWRIGDVLHLEVHDNGAAEPLDQWALPLGEVPRLPGAPHHAGPRPQVSEDDTILTVSGANFRLVFSRTDGRLVEGIYDGRTVLTGGPDLHLRGDKNAEDGEEHGPGPWHPSDEGPRAQPGPDTHTVTVTVRGRYGSAPGLPVTFRITVDGTGLIETDCIVERAPEQQDQPEGGYREFGITYRMPPAVSQITWRTRSQWSVYPAGHLGRPSGTAVAIPDHPEQRYRVTPEWPWEEDTKDFFLFGPDDPGRASNDFRALRTRVHRFAATAPDGYGLRVESDGSLAARVDTARQLYVDTAWNYPDFGYGQADYERDPIRLADGSHTFAAVRLGYFPGQDSSTPD